MTVHHYFLQTHHLVLSLGNWNLLQAHPKETSYRQRSALLRSITIKKQVWIVTHTKFLCHVEQTRGGNNSPYYAWSQACTWVNPQAAKGRCLPFQVSLAIHHISPFLTLQHLAFRLFSCCHSPSLPVFQSNSNRYVPIEVKLLEKKIVPHFIAPQPPTTFSRNKRYVFIMESESPTKESFTCGIPSASSDSLPISCKTLAGKMSQTKFNWHSALYPTWVEKSKAGILESCCYGDIAFVKYFTKLGLLNEVLAMKFSFSS